MQIKDEIWILADNRPGTFSQSIGLAEEMRLEYKIINLNYSFLSALPNCFFSQSFWRLKKDSREKIKNFGYLPRIIISSGRRSAPIALHLKNQVKQGVKVIQIMNPNLDFKKFDYVILPEHDRFDAAKFSNLITTIGSLTKINDNIIALECEKFSPWFANEFSDNKKVKIALFLGGSSKKTKFEKKSAIKLAHIVSKIANNMNATLLVANSRRTDELLSQIIKENLKCDFRFFDWKKVNQNNPYLATMGYADFFIVSGDSVSMISECASLAKPLYIFDDRELSSKKHKSFHKSLYVGNFARKLSKNLEVLDNFHPKKLQESKRVFEIIKSDIFLD